MDPEGVLTAQDMASSRENREAEEVTALHINMPEFSLDVSTYFAGSVAIATRLRGKCGLALLTAGVRSWEHLDKAFVRFQLKQGNVASAKIETI